MSNMEIAEMIVDCAKRMEKDEEESKMIEIQISCHVHGDGSDRECFDKVVGFTIHPLAKDNNRLVFAFKHAQWTHNRSSKYINKLCKAILRQMLRDIIASMDVNNDDSIFEIPIHMNVMYKKKVLFTDEYFIDEPITMASVRMNSPDDDGNENVGELEKMLVGYLEICLGMDM